MRRALRRSDGSVIKLSASRPHLRIFPLGTVLFPGATLNLHIFEARYVQMISECLASGEAFGIVLIRDGSEAGDPNVDPFNIGTVAEIVDVTPLERGRLYVTTVGTERFRIERIVEREPYLLAEVSAVEEDTTDSAELEQLEYEVRARFSEYRRLLVAFSVYATDGELPPNVTEASFVIAESLQIADRMKQGLLESGQTRERLSMELDYLRRLLPQLQSLVDRRKHELARTDGPQRPRQKYRVAQEKFFGKYFSAN